MDELNIWFTSNRYQATLLPILNRLFEAARSADVEAIIRYRYQLGKQLIKFMSPGYSAGTKRQRRHSNDTDAKYTAAYFIQQGILKHTDHSNNFHSVYQIEDGATLRMLDTVWTSVHIGRALDLEHRQGYQQHRAKAYWTKADRHAYSLGRAFSSLFMIWPNQRPPVTFAKLDGKVSVSEADERRLTHSIQLFDRTHRAIKDFKTPRQRVLHIMGVMLALLYAMAFALSISVALGGVLHTVLAGNLATTLTYLLCPLQAVLSTRAFWLMTRKHVPGLINRFFGQSRIFEGLFVYLDDQGQRRKYQHLDYKVLLGSILSVSVGLLLGALVFGFYQTFLSSLPRIAYLTPVLPGLSIMLGVVTVMSVSLLMLGEMLPLFQYSLNPIDFIGSLWSRIKQHFNSFSSEKDYPQLTQQQRMRQRRAAIVWTSVISVFLIVGLLATMMTAMWSLQALLPGWGLFASLTPRAIEGISVSLLVLSFLGQLNFLLTTGGRFIARMVTGYYQWRHGESNAPVGYLAELKAILTKEHSSSRLGKWLRDHLPTWGNAFGNAWLSFRAIYTSLGQVVSHVVQVMGVTLTSLGAFLMPLVSVMAGEEEEGSEVYRHLQFYTILEASGYQCVSSDEVDEAQGYLHEATIYETFFGRPLAIVTSQFGDTKAQRSVMVPVDMKEDRNVATQEGDVVIETF